MNYLRKYLKNEIFLVETELKNVVKDSSDIVSEAAGYAIESGGKRLRPILILIVGKIFNSEQDKLIKAAAAIELIHTATLIHDDVIDHSDTRRGKLTIKQKWGDEIAILIADYLFSNAFNLALDTLNPSVLKIISNATNKICEGELYQLQKRNTFFSLDDYYNIIQSKTAELFSACANIAASLSECPSKLFDDIIQFGLNFGMAFQIIDDVLDYVGDKNKVGKPLGNDLKEGKQTLPFIYALQKAEMKDKEDLIHAFRNGKNLPDILEIIKKYDGIKYSFESAKEYVRKAKNCIISWPKSRYTDIALKLSDDILTRDF